MTYRENNSIEDLLTLHTLHTEKTIQENAINCKRQEVDDKILLIKVQMYITCIYNFSMNFHKVILEKEVIDLYKNYHYHIQLNFDFSQK